jgi:pimeloyl-ACP methyl ester carboxylesterase
LAAVKTTSRRPDVLVAALVLVLATPLLGCSPQRTIEAVGILRDVAEMPDPGREQPRRKIVTFTIDGRQHEGDIYVLHEPPKATIIMVPGIAPAGREDPRLVAFAGTLARAHFEVFVPDVEGMRQLRVSAADARVLADAVLYMAERDPGRPLGMVGLSFALGPSVLALFEPGVERHTDFILAIGGYYDLEQALTYFTTGYYRLSPDEPWRHRALNGRGKWAFVLANADRLKERQDEEILQRMAGRKIMDRAADVSDLVERLGPEGRDVYALMTNDDPERVTELVEALPTEVRAEIRALDLSRRPIATLDVEFILIHGRNDPIIPFTQSVTFAETMGAGRAHLYLIDNLDHVNLEPADLMDSITMLQAVYRLLSIRDSR